jgi:hypothetical protein
LPDLDCSKLQCKYARKNFSLFSGDKKKKERSALCNYLQPTNLTPLLCLQWAKPKQSNPNQYSAQPYMLAVRLYTESHLKISKLLFASSLNWELSNVSFHSTDKEIEEISKTHWF